MSCNGIGSVLGVLGRRFDPGPAQWVKDPLLPQLRMGCNCISDLIPGPGAPQAKREKEKEMKTCFLGPHLRHMEVFPG